MVWPMRAALAASVAPVPDTSSFSFAAKSLTPPGPSVSARDLRDHCASVSARLVAAVQPRSPSTPVPVASVTEVPPSRPDVAALAISSPTSATCPATVVTTSGRISTFTVARSSAGWAIVVLLRPGCRGTR